MKAVTTMKNYAKKTILEDMEQLRNNQKMLKRAIQKPMLK